ncbi:hypothetical protein [Actinomyces ruminicola]|uniref:hypothetical protein n=2 Tax=Actinomyces TaxID=1654 RepID=UPI0011CBEEBB|nr:hypothetical protein [Actinomyces ruminicola]
MMRRIIVVLANMGGVLLGEFSLILLEGVAEIHITDGVGSVPLFLFPLGLLAAAMSVVLLLGPGRPGAGRPNAQAS